MLLLASPAFAAKDTPADAAAYDKAYDALRVKARAAYLAPTPIDEAVTPTDLKTLAPAAEAVAPAERAKKTVDFVEALKAVKTLQGAPDQPPLAPAIKSRLMGVVYQRLGLSGAEQSQAIGKYLPMQTAPGPFAKEPPPSVVAAVRQRELESQKRAQSVMAGGGVLREDRSAAGQFSPMNGVAGVTGLTGGYRPPENMTAADFKPPNYKVGPASEVPVAQGEHGDPHKKGTWAKIVDVAKTPLPGTSGWKQTYANFAERRMAASERLDQEGSKLLEKGGAWNTVKAGWKATEGFGNRLVAGDKKAVTSIAAGAAAAAAATAVVLVATAAAPVVGTAALVMAGTKVAVWGITAYMGVQATSELVREPDYANAGGLALNFVGAKYAGAVAHKAGELTHKVAHAVALQTGRTVAVEGAAVGTAAVGSVVVTEGALAAGAKLAAQEFAATARVVAHTSGHVAAEGVHEIGKHTVHTAFARHEEPVTAATTQVAVGGQGPFRTVPMSASVKPH